MAQRVRLDVGTRREQLLAAGVALFGARPYAEVEIADIARAAGVSRGLLYHYFPDKRSFFAAVVARQVEELARATRTDPADPPRARLRAGVDAYFDFIEAHPQWYRSLYRSTANADDVVRSLLDQAHSNQARYILSLFPGLDPTPARRLAVRSWIALLASAGVGWLEGVDASRDEVREMCCVALLAALGIDV
ncbi:TetR/AcrR family transcriptional regulator [Pseudonocardia yuanmonensis]|uniref:TetR/AcrR family transcriptional regulator n=1 Tax=Pseudonocardia yuanmonensis TaxID=1095914 RepID=A0ABP8X9K2_9PSEU